MSEKLVQPTSSVVEAHLPALVDRQGPAPPHHSGGVLGPAQRRCHLLPKACQDFPQTKLPASDHTHSSWHEFKRQDSGAGPFPHHPLRPHAQHQGEARGRGRCTALELAL